MFRKIELWIWMALIIGSVLTLEWVRRKQQLLSSKSFRTASWAAGQCLTHINACRFLTCFDVKRCAYNMKCFCLFQEQNIWHDPVLSEPDPLLKARETWVCVCFSYSLNAKLHCCLGLVCLCTLYTWNVFAWISTHWYQHLWDVFCTRHTVCCMMGSTVNITKSLLCHFDLYLMWFYCQS